MGRILINCFVTDIVWLSAETCVRAQWYGWAGSNTHRLSLSLQTEKLCPLWCSTLTSPARRRQVWRHAGTRNSTFPQLVLLNPRSPKRTVSCIMCRSLVSSANNCGNCGQQCICPCLNVFECHKMFSKVGRMFLHRISPNVWKKQHKLIYVLQLCAAQQLLPPTSQSPSLTFSTLVLYTSSTELPLYRKRRPRNECAKKRKKIWIPRKSDKWRSWAIHRWEPTAFTFDWEFTSSGMLRCVTERLFPDVLEHRKAFICRVMQPKSTASLSIYATKLVLLAEPPEPYTGCFTTLGHNCRRWFPRSLWSKKFI